jgi:hypothetical protein
MSCAEQALPQLSRIGPIFNPKKLREYSFRSSDFCCAHLEPERERERGREKDSEQIGLFSLLNVIGIWH